MQAQCFKKLYFLMDLIAHIKTVALPCCFNFYTILTIECDVPRRQHLGRGLKSPSLLFSAQPLHILTLLALLLRQRVPSHHSFHESFHDISSAPSSSVTEGSDKTLTLSRGKLEEKQKKKMFLSLFTGLKHIQVKGICLKSHRKSLAKLGTLLVPSPAYSQGFDGVNIPPAELYQQLFPRMRQLVLAQQC